MEALADKLVDFQRRENTDIPLLKKQLAETAQGIENLLNAIQQGILTPSTKARLEQLEETKAQLETSLTLAELQKPIISREQFLFWLHRFRSLDMSKPTERQRLIDSFINAIYLYDDKIVLTFNYKDGSKTVSLQDVEGSDLGAATAPNPQSFACKGLRIFSYSSSRFTDSMLRCGLPYIGLKFQRKGSNLRTDYAREKRRPPDF